MPKRAAGLTAAKVHTAKPGRYVDGDGLMLFVRSPDARFWLLRYSHGGKRREAGLDPIPSVPVACCAEVCIISRVGP